MSLIDALLLDPVRMNVWIAARTDGIGGSGTQTDPYDGGSLEKFDTVNQVNPFEYLVTLQEHRQEVAKDPHPLVALESHRGAGTCRHRLILESASRWPILRYRLPTGRFRGISGNFDLPHVYRRHTPLLELLLEVGSPGIRRIPDGILEHTPLALILKSATH